MINKQKLLNFRKTTKYNFKCKIYVEPHKFVGHTKNSKIPSTVISNGKGKQIGTKIIFEEIMVESFSDLPKY